MIVYIREAHPEMLKEGHKTGVEGRPDNFEERVILATECLVQYKFTMPTIIDYMDGKVNEAYAAAPIRTTITDLDGNVAYYAGRGPFDFKIPKIERALKRIIAGAGYMPDAPPVKWGEAVEGLRCGLSVDPADPAVGDEVAVKIVFENTGDVECDIYYGGPEDIAADIAIRNGEGQRLALEAVLDNSERGKRYRKREIGWKNIAKGAVRQFEMEAKIVKAEGTPKPAAGEYTAELVFGADEKWLTETEGDKPAAVWLGEVRSGKSALDVSLVREEGCADCHSGGDYHHKGDRDCKMCHVGKVGTDDFGMKKDACSCCHKRSGKFGRRKIFGADGDFDKPSLHIGGMITDDKCAECHDAEGHGDGEVSLIGGKSGAEFCQTCHKKDGFDKCAHGAKLGDDACGSCHNAHGSDHPSLLKEPYALSGKGEESWSKKYALCWSCHDRRKVMGPANAFGKLHARHVQKEKASCAACHDVHGGADAGEPGMIDLAFGIEKGSGAKFVDGRDASGSFSVEADKARGLCWIDCHERHAPENYLRGGKGGTLKSAR